MQREEAERDRQEIAQPESPELEADHQADEPSVIEKATELAGDVVTAIYDGRYPDDQAREVPSWAQEIRDQTDVIGTPGRDPSTSPNQLDTANQYEDERQTDQHRSNHI